MSISLEGRRIFVVEDESLIMMLLEEALTDSGCIVAGAASRLDEALAKAAVINCDVAILDVNLDGKQTAPVADLLARRGIPFALVTGYGSGLLEPFHGAPVVAKPFFPEDLERGIRAALSADKGPTSAQPS
jgi:CheY-like chemotaxis protein